MIGLFVIANEERVKQSLINDLQTHCFVPRNDENYKPFSWIRANLFFLLFLFIPILTFSQKQLEIVHAGSLKFDENLGNGAKRLIGDVQFKHEDVLMFCDSAYFYSDNSLDAFGHVHVQQSDTIHLFGDFLNYNGNTKKAIVSKNVVAQKGDMQLTTAVLNYDVEKSIGFYTTSAKIINKENELSSKQGYFYAKANELHFKNNVVLTNRNKGEQNEQYTMTSDTMRYNTSTKITTFAGPTTIKSDDNTIYCEDGWYDTEKDISRFSKNSYIITKEQKMSGDSLYYDRTNGMGKAIKNVTIIDTIQNTTITGNYAIYYEFDDLSIITDNALLIQISDDDTLYLHADTLKAVGIQKKKTEVRKQKLVNNSQETGEKKQKAKIKTQKNKEPIIKDTITQITSSDTNNRYIYAYNHVKFFKKDLQGKCDSVVYCISDSVMKMYGMPTIWSEENQLTADSVKLNTGKNTIKSIELHGSAFIVSQEDSLRFNQIRGKHMTGYFKQNELYLINVEGNGQTIYFPKEKETIKGVNRADCSDLKIYLKNKKIDRINFITKPDATLYPLDELPLSELKLKDFTWRQEFRPLKMEDIFKW